MKRKLSLIIILSAVLASSVFAAGKERRSCGTEFGFGSGYTFYGDRKTKDRINSIDKTNEIILYTDTAVKLPLADIVYFNFGADNMFDARWSGGKHIYIFDYSFLTGFSIYPGLQGLHFDVDYALGCRTSFFDLDDEEDEISSTKWGNGFKFGFGYDFNGNKPGFTPVIGTFWRHMPRGNSSDNTIGVYFRLEHK